MCDLQSLPLEVLAEVLSKLSVGGLCKLARCCKYLHELVFEEIWWKNFYIDGSTLLFPFTDECLAFLSKRFPFMRSLQLKNVPLVSDVGLMNLIENRFLSSLYIENAPNITHRCIQRIHEWMASYSVLLQLKEDICKLNSLKRMSYGSRSMALDRIARSTSGKLWDLLWVLNKGQDSPEPQSKVFHDEIMELMDTCKAYYNNPSYGFNHYRSDSIIHCSVLHSWQFCPIQLLVTASQDGITIWDYSNGSLLHTMGEKGMNIKQISCCNEYIMAFTQTAEVIIWQLICGVGDNIGIQIALNFSLKSDCKKKCEIYSSCAVSLFGIGDETFLQFVNMETICKVQIPSGRMLLKEIFTPIKDFGCFRALFSKCGQTLVLACKDWQTRFYSLNQSMEANKEPSVVTDQPTKEQVNTSPKTRRIPLFGGLMYKLGSAFAKSFGAKLQELCHPTLHKASKPQCCFANYQGSLIQRDTGLLGKSNRDQLALSPDGQLLAMANLDGTVVIWCLAQCVEVAFLKSTKPPSNLVFITPSELALQSGKWIYVYDVLYGKEIGRGRIPKHTTHWDLVQTQASKWDVVAGGDHDWRVYGISSEKNFLREVRGPIDKAITPVGFMVTRGNMLFISGNTQGSTTEFGPYLTFQISTLNYQFQKQWDVAALDVNAEGTLLIGVTKSNTYQVIDIETGDILFKKKFSPKGVKPLWCTHIAAAFIPMGDKLVLTDGQKGFAIVDSRTRQEVHYGEHPISNIAMDFSGRYFITGAVVEDEARSILYDLSNGAPEEHIQDLSICEETSVTFSPSSFLCVAHKGVSVYKLQGRELRQAMRLKREIHAQIMEDKGSAGVHTMRFSPNGKLLAVLEQPHDLPSLNTLIRVFQVEEHEDSWPLVGCFDGGKLVTGLCWLDNSSVLLGHPDGLVFKQAVAKVDN